ncbi:MAG: TonB-dependent receptor domain-containing protein [Bryobacteraceae bacterium]
MRLCVFLLLALPMGILHGQPSTGDLRVEVRDASGSPLEAQGEIAGPEARPRIVFRTLADGAFTLEGLPYGEYRLTLSRPGFESARSIVRVDSPLVERAFVLGLAPVETSVIVRVLPGSLEGVPGATAELVLEDIETARPFSVKEALRRIPGVHVVDEDSFGVNLNVGVRGLNPRRTQRTLILEDGAPIHLAPYSDPSAHYHTPPELIQGIEVIKGSGQIQHGPQTVGGMMNFVTEPAPRKLLGGFGAVLGSRDFRGVQAKGGMGGERAGLLAHMIHRQGAGTREHHAHEVTHLGVKGRVGIAPGQALQLKTGYYEENSRFSEAGMSEAQFAANPLGNPFRHDRFELQRFAAQAIHTVELRDGIRLATNAYYQKIDRASYRQADFSTDQMTANPETGCVGDARVQYDLFADRCGNKMRPRNYEFFGVEPRLDFRGRILGIRNETAAGVRFHREYVTRRRFNGITPDAREDSPGALFRDWNEIRANAFPAFVQSTFFAGGWAISPGVRTERISAKNRALRRNNVAMDTSIQDTQTMVLPGIGGTYFGLPRTTLFAGVHQGFAPPRPDDNLNPTDPNFTPVSPERSTNVEAGIRSVPLSALQVDATLFRIDFRNQIVPGESVGLPELTWANAGRTLNQGLEVGSRLNLGQLLPSGHSLYLTAAYTWLFEARFNSDQFNGNINVRGNRLPYAPRHLFSPAIVYQHRRGVQISFGVESVGEQFADDLNRRAAPPDGITGIVPGFTTVNGAVNIPLREKGPVLFLSCANLADRRFIASRVDGIQVGRPRQVFGGLRWGF